MATVVHTAPVASPGADAAAREARRVSWGAIFAGAIIGLALMMLLTLLGVGIGMAVIDPAQDVDPLAGIATGSGIYLAVVQLISLLVGGFAAARLAGVPFKQGSMLHGVAVWALATFAMFWLATTAVGNVAGGVASTLSAAGKGATSAVQAVIPDDLSLSSLPNIDMESLPPELRRKLESQGLTVDNAREEMVAAFRDVVSKQEQSAATDVATDTAKDIVSSPQDAGEDIQAMVDKLFGGPDAVLSEEDRQQMLQQMNERLGLSEEEAQQMMDQAQAQVEEATAQAEQAVEEAKAKATEAAQTASDAVSAAAFGAFVASLLGLIAAAVGALIGRPKDMVLEPAYETAPVRT